MLKFPIKIDLRRYQINFLSLEFYNNSYIIIIVYLITENFYATIYYYYVILLFVETDFVNFVTFILSST